MTQPGSSVSPALLPSVADLDVSGLRVFVRVDFNVPLDDKQQITDDARIVAALPTIKHLVERGAKVILGSHLGRPKGKSKDTSLLPVAMRLAELLVPVVKEIKLTDEPVGDGARKVVQDLREGEVVLLENLRWTPAEEKNDEVFAKSLASYADVYVNDAFGTAHRAHASTAGMVRFFEPTRRGAGFLLLREIAFLSRLLGEVKKPYVVIVGGAKVSDKIGVLDNLSRVANSILIGGAMANTFLKAKGVEVGKSRVEDDKLHVARAFLKAAETSRVEVLLPTDVIVADNLDATQGKAVPVEGISTHELALDIGPKTVLTFTQRILAAQTVFWNGPLGLFEKPGFAHGTLAIAKALAASSATTVIGGGDSVAAAAAAGVTSQVSHVSTGGGASLEFVEGQDLPGIAALRPSAPSHPEKRSAS